MLEKIPATIITGFLGSGKTTLIRHLLTHAKGKRIALIINEFGDLGIDGDILKGCNEEICSSENIVELSNGCICCTVADDFIPSLEMLLSRTEKPDHIVIETSGLALPQPLVRAFNWPEISTKVTVDAVVTVVDGNAVNEGRFAHDVAALDNQRTADENLDHETPLSELFEDQIACADMIVINKSDLLSGQQAAELNEQLSTQSRQGVQVLNTVMGVLPVDVLLGQSVGAENSLAERHEVHHHHHGDDDHDDHEHEHSHDAFESFIVTRAEVADADAFSALVSKVIKEHNILRLKGTVAVKGKPMRQVLQAVGPRVDCYFDRPFSTEEPRQTSVVVIGHAGLDQASITTALRA